MYIEVIAGIQKEFLAQFFSNQFIKKSHLVTMIHYATPERGTMDFTGPRGPR
jgi:hypothetical protein